MIGGLGGGMEPGWRVTARLRFFGLGAVPECGECPLVGCENDDGLIEGVGGFRELPVITSIDRRSVSD
jgi:hypothetical protein